MAGSGRKSTRGGAGRTVGLGPGSGDAAVGTSRGTSNAVGSSVRRETRRVRPGGRIATPRSTSAARTAGRLTPRTVAIPRRPAPAAYRAAARSTSIVWAGIRPGGRRTAPCVASAARTAGRVTPSRPATSRKLAPAAYNSTMRSASTRAAPAGLDRRRMTPWTVSAVYGRAGHPELPGDRRQPDPGRIKLDSPASGRRGDGLVSRGCDPVARPAACPVAGRVEAVALVPDAGGVLVGVAAVVAPEPRLLPALGARLPGSRAARGQQAPSCCSVAHPSRPGHRRRP